MTFSIAALIESREAYSLSHASASLKRKPSLVSREKNINRLDPHSKISLRDNVEKKQADLSRLLILEYDVLVDPRFCDRPLSFGDLQQRVKIPAIKIGTYILLELVG